MFCFLFRIPDILSDFRFDWHQVLMPYHRMINALNSIKQWHQLNRSNSGLCCVNSLLKCILDHAWLSL